MASGYGLNGNPSRCFFHFQDFMVCMKTSDFPVQECHALRDDYLECLHAFKERARKKEIEEEARKQQILRREAKNGGGGSSDSGGGGH